jgi:hypothetical protein
MNKLIILPLAFFLAGCSTTFGLSLDERYQSAYEEVVTDPSSDNMTRYMQLSKEVAERDMRKLRPLNLQRVKAIKASLNISNNMEAKASSDKKDKDSHDYTNFK